MSLSRSCFQFRQRLNCRITECGVQSAERGLSHESLSCPRASRAQHTIECLRIFAVKVKLSVLLCLFMISFQTFTLDNGLPVVVHQDPNSAEAVVALAYRVGSRDEDPQKTGLAHLLEHLMFCGSKHVPHYDRALQRAGGQSNAYTTPDLTVYYCTLPAVNIETAFWVESDRMQAPLLSKESLAIQKKVVVEEFQQHYLNQPYGDAWSKLCGLAYTQHPYRWPTIGQSVDHILGLTRDDTVDFFESFYTPSNAVLVVAGPVDCACIERMSAKWFGAVRARHTLVSSIVQEPAQDASRILSVKSDVPLHALYKAYRTPSRDAAAYYISEMASGILGESRSSRLYSQLVEERKIFNTLQSYTTSHHHPGLLIIAGHVHLQYSLEDADAAVEETIEEMRLKGVSAKEMQKVSRSAETREAVEALDLTTRAQELAEGTLLGNTNLTNEYAEQMRAVTTCAVSKWCRKVLQKRKCSTLLYHSTRL